MKQHQEGSVIPQSALLLAIIFLSLLKTTLLLFILSRVLFSVLLTSVLICVVFFLLQIVPVSPDGTSIPSL